MAAKPGQRQRALAIRLHWLRKQQQWIAEHGGDLDGYIRRYGVTRGPSNYEVDQQALGLLQQLFDIAKSKVRS